MQNIVHDLSDGTTPYKHVIRNTIQGIILQYVVRKVYCVIFILLNILNKPSACSKLLYKISNRNKKI